jgi:hypothetical protein
MSEAGYGGTTVCSLPGRDRTVLVEQVLGTSRLVTEALDGVAARPALCFVDGEWGLFSRPFDLNGVHITRPKALVTAIEQPGGPLTECPRRPSC